MDRPDANRRRYGGRRRKRAAWLVMAMMKMNCTPVMVAPATSKARPKRVRPTTDSTSCSSNPLTIYSRRKGSRSSRFTSTRIVSPKRIMRRPRLKPKFSAAFRPTCGSLFSWRASRNFRMA